MLWNAVLECCVVQKKPCALKEIGSMVFVFLVVFYITESSEQFI